MPGWLGPKTQKSSWLAMYISLLLAALNLSSAQQAVREGNSHSVVQFSASRIQPAPALLC